jgi:hypothetical protein
VRPIVLVVTLFASIAHGQILFGDPAVTVISSPAWVSGSSAGTTYNVPTLSGAPFPVAAQCQGQALTFNGSPITVTRASSAYCPKSDGTFALVTNNAPRVGRFGLLVERASTQLLTAPRDFTNAAWVKSNVTAAKTATGADGVANAASTLTATANNGTALQTVTTGAAPYAASVSIRRRTGAGTVLFGVDNLVAPCDVTTALALAMAGGCQWLRVGMDGDDWHDTTKICQTGCGAAAQSLANPVVGFKLGTSGDAIDVDFAQLEANWYDTTPISGSSRAGELATLSAVGFPTSTGFFEARVTPRWSGARINSKTLQRPGLDSRNGSGAGDGIVYYVDGAHDVGHSFTYGVRSASSHSLTGLDDLSRFVYGKPRLWRLQWSSSAETVKVQGTVLGTNVTTINVPAGQNTIRLGGFFDGTTTADAFFSDLRSGLTTTDDASAFATVGNSIMVGAYDIVMADAIQTNLSGRKYVQAFAVSGSSIADSGTQYNTSVRGNGFTKVIDNAGINDMLGGSSAATAWAAMQPILDGMVSDGVFVVLVNVTPCRGYSGCPMAAVTTYNASEAAWVAANPGHAGLVDANALLRDPNDHDSLAPICLSAPGASDSLHPNDACSVLMAAAIAATL